MADTLLTLQEVANLLKVAEKTVYTMAQRREFQRPGKLDLRVERGRRQIEIRR